MTRCSIINCSNTTNKGGNVNRDISFHRFPNDPHIKNKWVEATGRKKWFPTRNSRICSIHFQEDTFTGPSQYRRVINTACPTIDIVVMSSDDKMKPSTSSSQTVEIELVPVKQEQFIEEDNGLQSANEEAGGCITDVRSIKGEWNEEDGECDYSFSDLIKLNPATCKNADEAIENQEKVTEDAARGNRRRHDSDSDDSYTISIKTEEQPLADDDSLEINDQDSKQTRKLKLILSRANEVIRMKKLEVKKFRERNRRLTKKVTHMADVIQSLRKQLADKASTAIVDVQIETSDSDDSVITDPMENADMDTK